MICLRCGHCCTFPVVVVKDPKKGPIEGNLICVNAKGPGNPPCPHLVALPDNTFVCKIHDYPWFAESPCGRHSQIEHGNTECRLGRWMLDNQDSAAKIRDLQNIGSYVLPEASQDAIEPCGGVIRPYVGKAVKTPINEATRMLQLPPETPEIGKFVRPTQLISKHGAKWRWTSFLNDEVMPDVLGDAGKPWSFLDAFGGTGIITFMAAEGDWNDSLVNVYYNDFGAETANMFRVVKSQPQKVIVAINAILGDPATRDHLQGEGFFAIKEMSRTYPDPCFRAAAYILRMKLSFGGKGDNPSKCDAPGYVEKIIRKAQNTAAAVTEWSLTLQNVVLWKKHFAEAISDFLDREKDVQRIIFLDPPYIGCQGGEQYEVQMTEAEHVELARIIHERKATYIVTHLDNPDYRRIYGTADSEWNVTARYTMDRGMKDFQEVTAVWYAK